MIMMKKIKKICCAFLVTGIMLPQVMGSTAEAASGTWKHNNVGWWYSYSNGTYAKSEWLSISGKWYYFDTRGYMVTGWKKISGKWYYFASSGAMQTGWKKISGKWYFLKSGVMQTGWQKISGKWYFFKDGAMVTGRQKIGGVYYTFDRNGVYQNLEASEIFLSDNITYCAPLDEAYYALFLSIKKDGSFSVGTYDESLGGDEPRGKLTNILRQNSTTCKMEVSGVPADKWLKNGTEVYLFRSGTKISTIPTSFFENGRNTSYAFGLNPYAFGKDWRELTSLPKDAIYFDFGDGGYWFLLK